MCLENSMQISLMSWDQYALGNRLTWFESWKIMSSMVMLMRYFGSILRFSNDIEVSEKKRVAKYEKEHQEKFHLFAKGDLTNQ